MGLLLFLACPNSVFAANACQSNGTGGGNFNLVATWTSCGGTTPQAADSITIVSGDTVTLVATTIVGGITINTGGIFAANTRTLTDTDGYTNNGSHTGTTSAMTLSGSGSVIDGNGSYTPTGVVTMSVGAKTIAAGSALSFPRVTITGVTVTNASTTGFSVTTALAGTGTLAQGTSGVLNLAGTSAITGFDASPSPNEVHYTSTAANQTINAGTYHHLFIEKSGRTGTLGGPVTVQGNLTVTAGTLADGGFQITGNGTGMITLLASTIVTLGTAATATSFPTGFTGPHSSLSATSTVTYNSNQAQTISGVPEYGNLTTSTTVTPGSVTKTAGGALIVKGSFTNGASNSFADGGFTITLKDGATMTGPHTGSGKIVFTGGSTSHSVSGTYSNVELDDTNGVLLSGTTTINGTLSITSGTFDTDARTVVVSGATTVNGGTLLISSTTLTKTFGTLTIATGAAMNFTAAEAVTINGNLIVNGTGVISGTSGIWTFQKVGGGMIDGTAPSLTILGTVTFATQYSLPATFTVNTFTVNTGINETNAGTLTVNTALSGTGTFTQGVNTVLNLGGTSTITTLNASVDSNEVHYISTTANQAIKTATYYHLFLDKPGRTGSMSGVTNILGNFVSTADTTDFLSSTVTVTGTSDISGILKDQNNSGLVTFGGKLTMHSGSSWLGNAAEACNFTFHNGMQYDGGSFVSGSGNFMFDTNDQSITGASAVTIEKIVVTGVQLTNSNFSPVTVSTSLSGTGTFIQDTNTTLTIAGTSTITTLVASASGNTVNYTGTTSQTVNTATFRTLDVGGNTSGVVTIGGDVTANTALTLGATIFSTSFNKVSMAAGATLSRTSGFINGNLQKNVGIGSPSRTFEVGSGINYTPVQVSFTAVTVPGDLVVHTMPGDHASIATANLVIGKTASRSWTATNTGITFATYDATLTFVPADVDSAATPANFVLAKFDSGTWSRPTRGTVTATSVSGTGLTSFSDFQIGEPVAFAPTPVPTESPASVPSSGGGTGGRAESNPFPQVTVTPFDPTIGIIPRIPGTEFLPAVAFPQGLPPGAAPRAPEGIGPVVGIVSNERPPLFDVSAEPVQLSGRSLIPFMIISAMVEVSLLVLGLFVMGKIRRYDEHDHEFIT